MKKIVTVILVISLMLSMTALVRMVSAQNSVTVSPYAQRFALTGDESGGNVYYYPSDDDGTFGPKTHIGTFGTGDGLGIADFDNDGNLDFMVAASNGTIYLFTSNGAGTFTISEAGTLSGTDRTCLRAADFNNDGWIDFVVGDYSNGGNIYVFLNNQDGTFTTKPLDRSWTSFGIFGLAVGDFNNDGKQDIVMTDLYGGSASGRVQLYLGNGDGTFTNSQVANLYADTGAGDPLGLAAGDFNNDGNLDIVVGGDATTASDKGAFYLYTGDGSGHLTFQGKAFSVDGSYSEVPQGAVDAYDFDRDGNLDIVAVNWSGDAFFFIKGNGDGTFQSKVAIDTNLGSSVGVAAPHEIAAPIPPPKLVGGEILPVNALQILAPYIAMALVVAAAIGISMRYKRRIP